MTIAVASSLGCGASTRARARRRRRRRHRTTRHFGSTRHIRRRHRTTRPLWFDAPCSTTTPHDASALVRRCVVFDDDTARRVRFLRRVVCQVIRGRRHTSCVSTTCVATPVATRPRVAGGDASSEPREGGSFAKGARARAHVPAPRSVPRQEREEGFEAPIDEISHPPPRTAPRHTTPPARSRRGAPDPVAAADEWLLRSPWFREWEKAAEPCFVGTNVEADRTGARYIISIFITQLTLLNSVGSHVNHCSFISRNRQSQVTDLERMRIMNND